MVYKYYHYDHDFQLCADVGVCDADLDWPCWGIISIKYCRCKSTACLCSSAKFAATAAAEFFPLACAIASWYGYKSGANCNMAAAGWGDNPLSICCCRARWAAAAALNLPPVGSDGCILCGCGGVGLRLGAGAGLGTDGIGGLIWIGCAGAGDTDDGGDPWASLCSISCSCCRALTNAVFSRFVCSALRDFFTLLVTHSSHMILDSLPVNNKHIIYTIQTYKINFKNILLDGFSNFQTGVKFESHWEHLYGSLCTLASIISPFVIKSTTCSNPSK